MKKINQIFLLLVIVSLTGICIFLNSYDEKQQHRFVDFEYLPDGNILKTFSLRYDLLVADTLWIKAIAYFSDQHTTKGNYKWLNQVINTVVTLDPLYEDPYEFGGIVLANYIGDTKHSTELMLKGMENVPINHPRYWYLPFFIAYNYWYFDWDFKTGAQYLEIASKFPQAPKYLPLLTARMYADASSAELALPFLDEMIRNASSETRRKGLIKRRSEILVNYHLDLLDNAVFQYKEKIGEYPETIDELLNSGVIGKIPVEPFGGKYKYNSTTYKFYSTKSSRIKLHERKLFN